MMTELAMSTRINNLDHRLRGVEQILPTLATKADLDRFATKADLERFATKADLERFATKEELAQAVTRVEFGLEEARRHALVLHEDLKSDIGLLAEHLSAVMQRLDRR